jgi:hypothetical protein
MSGLRLDSGMERPNGQKEGFSKRIGTRPMPISSIAAKKERQEEVS